jgi:hypothetical protein
LLGEVLDHVVALRLAVDEHVEADLLLEADHPLDLGANPALVLGLVDLPLAKRCARLADLPGLGVGADRGGREERQVEAGVLSLAADLERALAAGVLVGERSHPLAHRRVAGSLGDPPVLERPVVGVELGGNRLAPLPEATSQGHDLADLLPRERHPGAQLVVQHIRWRLGVEIDGRVQQRA